jgi:hypothetical protein
MQDLKRKARHVSLGILLCFVECSEFIAFLRTYLEIDGIRYIESLRQNPQFRDI